MTLQHANKSPYSASFTAAGLMHSNMNAVLPYLLKDDSTKTVKMIENSLEILPIKSVSARGRVANEMVKRFRSVPKSFWNRYSSLSEEQQRIALFYVLLKTYRLLYEFQVNVAVKKFNSVNNSLTADDLWVEFYNIASRDSVVDNWTDQTKTKAINTYLTILRQTGLLDSESGKLHRIDIDNKSYLPFLEIGEVWFLKACFIPTYEIEQIKNLAL